MPMARHGTGVGGEGMRVGSRGRVAATGSPDLFSGARGASANNLNVMGILIPRLPRGKDETLLGLACAGTRVS